jgi:hypothetical protein
VRDDDYDDDDDNDKNVNNNNLGCDARNNRVLEVVTAVLTVTCCLVISYRRFRESSSPHFHALHSDEDSRLLRNVGKFSNRQGDVFPEPCLLEEEGNRNLLYRRPLHLTIDAT